MAMRSTHTYFDSIAVSLQGKKVRGVKLSVHFYPETRLRMCRSIPHLPHALSPDLHDVRIKTPCLRRNSCKLEVSPPQKKNSVALVRERTIPTEREVSPNNIIKFIFCWQKFRYTFLIKTVWRIPVLDFRLPPRSRWALRSYAILRSE